MASYRAPLASKRGHGGGALAKAQRLREKLKKNNANNKRRLGPVQQKAGRRAKWGHSASKGALVAARQERAQFLGNFETGLKSQYDTGFGNEATITRKGSRVKVQKGFQEWEYRAPWSASSAPKLLKYGLYTPEGYTKTNSRIFAPKQKFRGGEYTPHEALLSDGKLLKTIRRSVFIPFKTTKRGGSKNYEAFTSREVRFDAGNIIGQTTWGDYLHRKKYSRSKKGKNYKKYYRRIYKQSEMGRGNEGGYWTQTFGRPDRTTGYSKEYKAGKAANAAKKAAKQQARRQTWKPGKAQYHWSQKQGTLTDTKSGKQVNLKKYNLNLSKAISGLKRGDGS